MPTVTIRNETNDTLNIAFRLVTPTVWKNDLSAGTAYIVELPSAPYTIEVRLDAGNSNRFSAQDSIKTFSDISVGVVAGGASVVLGNLVNGFPARAVAVKLMDHSVQAGKRFEKKAEGMVIRIPGVFIPVYNKTFAIRVDSDSGYTLWDVDTRAKL